jgi:hypothetical protein
VDLKLLDVKVGLTGRSAIFLVAGFTHLLSLNP